MNDELKQIKKIYGEEMMQLCRSLFPTILQEEGTLLSILKQVLAPTHSLAKDIIRLRREVAFEDWINSYVKKEEVKLTETDKTPFELMDEKGYILYECKSEKDIQAFKKYYQPDEKLCTFKGGRLNRCYVFFAVKKNVDEIQRKDFPNPMREDPYGTSVISIQFSKGNKNTLSIKNRYNHTITDPDSTFYNNLENIILGLTRSFEKYYGLKIEQEVKTSAANVFYNLSYVRGNDGRNYQYNLEVDGIFYCENNIIIKDGKVIDTYAMNKERYLLIDCFVVDLQGKKVFKPFSKKRDAFIDSINDVGKI
ncbi:MAG: hypothetical protein J6X02_05145, partial [Bacilli bacterium]|nr:hypothetical protein [Bacilli bacterium]